MLWLLQCHIGATSATTNPRHGGLRGHRELLYSRDNGPSLGRLFRTFPSRPWSPMCAGGTQAKRRMEKPRVPGPGTRHHGSSAHNRQLKSATFGDINASTVRLGAARSRATRAAAGTVRQRGSSRPTSPKVTPTTQP